jgi:hypothetical protein
MADYPDPGGVAFTDIVVDLAHGTRPAFVRYVLGRFRGNRMRRLSSTPHPAPAVAEPLVDLAARQVDLPADMAKVLHDNLWDLLDAEDAAPAVAAEAGQGEREAFEAFAQNCPMGRYSVDRKGDGYWSSHTQIMWDTWQARAAQPAPPSQGLKVAALGALDVLAYECSNGYVIPGVVEDADIRAERDAILAALNALPD